MWNAENNIDILYRNGCLSRTPPKTVKVSITKIILNKKNKKDDLSLNVLDIYSSSSDSEESYTYPCEARKLPDKINLLSPKEHISLRYIESASETESDSDRSAFSFVNILSNVNV